MIDSCARLGMEMVGVDAEWYRHVGDWRTDLKKWFATICNDCKSA
jgi:hypothetical protein